MQHIIKGAQELLSPLSLAWPLALGRLSIMNAPEGF